MLEKKYPPLLPRADDLARLRCSIVACWFFVFVGCDSATEVDSKQSAAFSRQSHTTQTRVARLPIDDPPPHRLSQTRELRQTDWFEDVTDRTGIRFAYHNGIEGRHFTLLETVGGGVALFDFDGDDDLDVFVVGGGRIDGPPLIPRGRPSALYRNEGGWRFIDVTNNLGIDTSGLYSHGCTVGDFDRDGFPDLIVSGFGGCQLWKNDRARRFLNVTESAGLRAQDWSSSVAAVDFDRDGWLDLYVANYATWQPGQEETCLFDDPSGKYRDVCSPSLYPGQRDRLWHNRRDGTFEDFSEQAKLVADTRGLGVIAVDFDDDGWQDVFVANDVQENQLYWGGPELPLREEGLLAGVAVSPSGRREGSMGVEVADFNGDGKPDLFYTNFAWENNSLLLNDGARGFLNVTESWKLAEPSRQWVGFGCVAADFDGDGWQDLFVANGHVLYDYATSPYYQPPQLFRNMRGTTFQEQSEHGGPYFSTSHVGRGVACGDLDNDGAPDLLVVHQNHPVTVLRNRRPPEHWVRLVLRGTASNLDGIGAKVTVRQAGRSWTRWLRGGGSYLSHCDPRPMFALPRDDAATVSVTWPCGRSEVFADVRLNQPQPITEGTGLPDDSGTQ